ncbi:hypothetical protein [uncultured Roseibium sp.]|uniref:hypothetical protein n=1 Tax=uncultured Roseibium sp. TaxID=1936171 RepID=UPI002602AD14|nr:hypothetical protein [uncultured Roseibium sp.]
MTVYVLHFSKPYKHARHYIGYTPDASAARRVQEHISGSVKGNPLVKAAIDNGATVTLAHEFPGASREFERWLKDRRDVGSWCHCCGIKSKPLPDPKNIRDRYRERKAAEARRYKTEAA